MIAVTLICHHFFIFTVHTEIFLSGEISEWFGHTSNMYEVASKNVHNNVIT
jgi:hypothetical protein